MLQRKFSVPHLFEFESARGHKNSYVVDQAIKDRLLYCALKQGTDYREYQLFDPRYSIDDFLFHWSETKHPDYVKSYNCDHFGAVNVDFSGAFSPCNEFMFLDISLNHPHRLLNYMDIYGFLQYAVNDSYIGLARKLSLHDNGDMPPFKFVRVILESDTNRIFAQHSGLVHTSYNSMAYRAFSKHFEPVAPNKFVSVQDLPFPLDRIPQNDDDVQDYGYIHMADDPMPVDVPLVVIPTYADLLFPPHPIHPIAPFLPAAQLNFPPLLTLDDLDRLQAAIGPVVPPNLGSDESDSDDDDDVAIEIQDA